MDNKKLNDFINNEFKVNGLVNDAYNSFVKLEKYINLNKIALDDNSVKKLFGNCKLLSSLLLIRSNDKCDNGFINYLLQVYDSYMNQINFLNKFKEFKKGSIEARNEIVRDNMPLVVYHALRYQNQGLDLEDLVQEGNIGLIYSLSKYNPDKGLFSTYSSFWIKQCIKRAIDNQSRNIRVSSYRNELIFKIKRANDELEQVLNRRPSNEEISVYLNLSKETIDNTMAVLKDTVSYDSTFIENDLFLIESIPDNKLSLEEKLLLNEEYEEVRKIIDTLTVRERMAVRLRYGFVNNKTYTLNEIAEVMNVSIARVHTLLSISLRKIRCVLDCNVNECLVIEKKL